MQKDLNLKSLEIRSFRGIKSYDLDFYDENHDQYKSMVFCGANGTGKSSFVQAFEYLFTGQVESLTGARDVKHDKVIIHKGDSKGDLCITAQIGDYEISRTPYGLTCPDELKDLIDDFKNGSFILNRKKLLSFIEARPKDRYDKFAELINYNHYDDIENSFRRCESNLKSQLQHEKDKLKTTKGEICNIYDCDFSEAYERTNDILKKNGLELIDEDCEIEEYLTENAISNNALEELENINVKSLNEEYLKQLSRYKEITLNELKSSNSLLIILDNAENYLTEEPSDKCPVCQNKIDSQDVLDQIKTKKEELEKSTQKLMEWQDETKIMIGELRELNYRLEDYDITDIINDLEALSSFDKSIDEMNTHKLTQIAENIETLKENYFKEGASLKIAGEVLNKLSEIQKFSKNIEKLTMEHEISLIAYDLFKEKKKKKLEDILGQIVDHIGKYYKFIHGDDAIHTPGIAVDKSMAITLRLVFGDEEYDPRGYSSEGHIDTLGLCIFLAFAKVFNKYKFIILDDIIATVDMTHKEKVIRLLFEEFGDYTFIITTHNKLWFEQLEAISNAYFKQKFKFTNIINWDENDGPQLFPYVSQEKRIEKYIEENDVFAAGNAIRRYFENVLDHVVRRNGIKMPLLKFYSVNTYYSHVKRHIRYIFKKSKFEGYYDEIFDEIEKTRYMGNLMSHNNESNYYLDISEIIQFRDAVYDFKDAVTCHNPNHSNSYLYFNRDKKQGLCKSRKCRDVFEF